MISELFFASFAPDTLEPDQSIGAKFERLLDRLDLPRTVKGQKVAVKMHLGGGDGFSTIHPFFARKLVRKLREAGAREVFVTDLRGAVRGAIDRGYTEEVLGCPIVPVCGDDEKGFNVYPVNPPLAGKMDRIELSKPILDADVILNFTHLKGHGVCGFGGASKNFSMGAVTTPMRQMLHSLEGGLVWDEALCTRCGACIKNCPTEAMSFKDNELKVFYHDCKFCQHCALICPVGAITMTKGGYLDFQKGMAMTSAKLLEFFPPERQLYITMLMDVTIFCDCWGMTTPRLIRDIGILAGRDIVAVEQASLDLVDKEELIPGALPKGWDLDPDTNKHFFERIHHKDPVAVVNFLEELGCGSREYRLIEVK